MRRSGILLHITSLPGTEGIGTMGASARQFVDFLHASGCSVWQMLPVGPTGYGNSPYQSPSAFAGNPLLIDLTQLEEDGLLEKGSVRLHPESDRVDYEAVFAEKETLLARSFAYGFQKVEKAVEAFSASHAWARPYAQYQALCEQYGFFSEWPVSVRRYYIDSNEKTAAILNNLNERVLYHLYVQYLFDVQFKALKEYANSRAVQLFGDIPIYAAPGSADVWMNPRLFQVDAELSPTRVAGVPPDYFSADGQLWGNPLYNWKKMAKEHYQWWLRRLQAMGERFDLLRIDHFIGFANYYSVSADAKTAKNGYWVKNNGRALFTAVKKNLPQLSIVAEDLGAVNARVRRLLSFCGYPGMKVLVFGFSGDDDNPHRPQNIVKNSVIYTGTHDNDTAVGWFARADEKERACARKLLHLKDDAKIADALVEAAFASKANRAIIPMQDLLSLDNSARMNLPGTVGNINWCYRMRESQLSEALMSRLKALNIKFGRNV